MDTDVTRVAPGWQFASDNTAGICPEAWAALQAANSGYAPSYGADGWTERACVLIRALFEHEAAQVFFVFNGTAANSLSLAALARSYHGIVCHEAAHAQTDECAAPEFFSGGAKLLPLPGAGAKLSAAAVLERMHEIAGRVQHARRRGHVLRLERSVEGIDQKHHGLAAPGSRLEHLVAARPR